MHTVPCNVCSETVEFDEVFARKADNLRVVRCKGCGLTFLNPTFTAAEHFAWYNNRYWNDVPTDAHGNYTAIPPDQVERWTRRAKGRIDYFATFCEPMKHKPNLHVLEIGCGYGTNLEEIRRRCPGAKLFAVEPNARLYAILRQRLPDLQMLGKTLETLSGVRIMFDCVLLSSVLDHVIDPTYLLKRVTTLLQPTGRGLVVTRNAAGNVGHVYDLDHLYYFTEGTLRQLMNNCHLQVVRVDARNEFGAPGTDYLFAVFHKK